MFLIITRGDESFELNPTESRDISEFQGEITVQNLSAASKAAIEIKDTDTQAQVASFELDMNESRRTPITKRINVTVANMRPPNSQGATVRVMLKRT